MMGWGSDGWSGWGPGSTNWLGMGLMMLLWVGVVALVVWAIVRLTRSESRPQQTLESPRSVLDRRFASGAIDAEQYAEARRLMDSQGATGTTASA